MAAEYTLLVYDAFTLNLLGAIPQYTSLTYKRRDVVQGEFQLALHRNTIEPDLISADRIFVVQRHDDEISDVLGDDIGAEFAGVILHRVYDAITETWTVRGPDLKWLLAGAQVVPASGQEYDAVNSVPAETALKGYVSRQLVNPSDSDRAIGAMLDGVTFEIEADAARGTTVSFNGRHVNLLTSVLQPIATSGNLLHDVVIVTDGTLILGYRYQVREPVDATRSTGAVPVVFSTGWDNVAALRYEENYLSVPNAVYVLGQGEGASRTVRTVLDSGSLATRFRREASIDSRNNATDAALDLDGQTVIDQAQAAARRVDAQPLPIGPARYRTDWDLGHDVTIAIPEIGVEFDRRIVEVSVTLNAQGEQIAVALGSTIRPVGRLVADALKRTNRVQMT